MGIISLSLQEQVPDTWPHPKYLSIDVRRHLTFAFDLCPNLTSGGSGPIRQLQSPRPAEQLLEVGLTRDPTGRPPATPQMSCSADLGVPRRLCFYTDFLAQKGLETMCCFVTHSHTCTLVCAHPLVVHTCLSTRTHRCMLGLPSCTRSVHSFIPCMHTQQGSQMRTRQTGTPGRCMPSVQTHVEHPRMGNPLCS